MGRLYCTAIMWPCTGCTISIVLHTQIIVPYVFPPVRDIQHRNPYFKLIILMQSHFSGIKHFLLLHFKHEPTEISNPFPSLTMLDLSRTLSFLQTIWQDELVSPSPRLLGLQSLKGISAELSTIKSASCMIQARISEPQN